MFLRGEVYRSGFDGVTTSSADEERLNHPLFPLIRVLRLRCRVCQTAQIGRHVARIAVSNQGIFTMTNALALMLLILTSSPADSAIPNSSTRNSPVVSALAAADSRPASRTMTSRERILQRRQTLKKSKRQSLRGGQQQAMAGLISLIQTNVAPDCWEFGGAGFSTGSGAGNSAATSRQNAENLAELIQQTTQPLSWEINGGNGSISIFSN